MPVIKATRPVQVASVGLMVIGWEKGLEVEPVVALATLSRSKTPLEVLYRPNVSLDSAWGIHSRAHRSAKLIKCQP